MEPKELAAAKRLFDAGRIVSFNEGREAGIKEVVEYIEKRILPYDFGSVFSKAPISFVEWQAKLKEWGIG